MTDKGETVGDHGIAAGDYSEIADEQLDVIEAADAALYNDILTVCELIFTNPARAQSRCPPRFRPVKGPGCV